MNEASGCACQLGSKASGNMWAFLVFCEDHCWLFVIINQCKKQSPCFEQLYACVYMCMCVCVYIYIYIYIYVVGLGMCFFVIKVQYTPVVIWKLWYYSLYGTIFVQTRLYESFLLLLQIVSKQIFPIQIVWKLLLWNGYYGMHR